MEDEGVYQAWAALGGLTLGAYLLGAIPFGLLLVKRFAHQDVREAGSGNIGATNVLRVAGKRLGAATLVLDAVKGAVPVLVAHGLGLPESAALVLGLAAFLGHCFPVYLKFKGGKGVATALGVLLAVHPGVAAISVGVFALGFLLTRVASVSSLLAVASVGGVALALGADAWTLALYAVMAAVVVYKHVPNLRRLAQGGDLKV